MSKWKMNGSTFIPSRWSLEGGRRHNYGREPRFAVSAGQLKDILAGFKAQMNTLQDEIKIIRSQSHGTGIPFFNGLTRSNPIAPRRIRPTSRPEPGPSRRVPIIQLDRPQETELSGTGSTPVMQDSPLVAPSRRLTRTHVSRADSERRRTSQNRRQDPICHIQQGVAGIILDYTTPFCADIMNAPKEPKVNPPAIDAYDGTSDPDVHLLAYRHHMYVQGTTDATWCKYFPSTLKGVASKWLEKLPAGTINTYAELEILFSARFMAYKEEKKTSMNLGRIQQGKDESLRSYVRRFNLESGQIPDLPDGVAFDNFFRGLKKGSFKFDLVKKSVRTMADALDEAESFIHATEICSVPKESKGMETTDHPQRKDKSDKKTSRPNGTWAIENKGYQETKDCKSLRRALDGLAAKGFLKSYISPSIGGIGKKFYKKSKSPYQRDGNDTDSEIVAVISGGLAAWGPIMRGQKDYASRLGQVMLSGKAPIDHFPKVEICESDRGKIATPHDDPLVIELKVANLKVRRILVDTGSPSDIIITTCLNRLEHDPKTIEKIHYPIIGFGGGIIHPQGIITLPLRVGGRHQSKNLNVRFLIVKDLTAYNIILGRPTLNQA
ncbi:uncharacterized protein [Spinacia oleracea]|uniref:Retrotransposon gag domain-containing protein n=1 Tax=Spinacia oleracea TaxID=3562 RepID=A0ABM3QXL4_SPIOL|nr:uncharacterized protein LOC130463089 [Spinacia oleracea]